MQTTPTKRYLNTDRQRVLNFVQSLDLTPQQSRYSASIFQKTSFTSKDLKVLFEIIASKAPISPSQLESLGLPTFVQQAAA